MGTPAGFESIAETFRQVVAAASGPAAKPVVGRVSGVNADKYTVDVDIDKIDPDTNIRSRATLTGLRVEGLSGSTDTGAFCIPDIGSYVQLKFDQDDPTKPYVGCPIGGGVPGGFSPGAWVFRDHVGQQVVVNPRDGSVSLQGYAVNIGGGAAGIVVTGPLRLKAAGPKYEDVGGPVHENHADWSELNVGFADAPQLAAGLPALSAADQITEFDAGLSPDGQALVQTSARDIRVNGGETKHVGGTALEMTDGEHFHEVANNDTRKIGGDSVMTCVGSEKKFVAKDAQRIALAIIKDLALGVPLDPLTAARITGATQAAYEVGAAQPQHGSLFGGTDPSPVPSLFMLPIFAQGMVHGDTLAAHLKAVLTAQASWFAAASPLLAALPGGSAITGLGSALAVLLGNMLTALETPGGPAAIVSRLNRVAVKL